MTRRLASPQPAPTGSRSSASRQRPRDAGHHRRGPDPIATDEADGTGPEGCIEIGQLLLIEDDALVGAPFDGAVLDADRLDGDPPDGAALHPFVADDAPAADEVAGAALDADDPLDADDDAADALDACDPLDADDVLDAAEPLGALRAGEVDAAGGLARRAPPPPLPPPALGRAPLLVMRDSSSPRRSSRSPSGTSGSSVATSISAQSSTSRGCSVLPSSSQHRSMRSNICVTRDRSICFGFPGELRALLVGRIDELVAIRRRPAAPRGRAGNARSRARAATSSTPRSIADFDRARAPRRHHPPRATSPACASASDPRRRGPRRRAASVIVASPTYEMIWSHSDSASRTLPPPRARAG